MKQLYFYDIMISGISSGTSYDAKDTKKNLGKLPHYYESCN